MRAYIEKNMNSISMVVVDAFKHWQWKKDREMKNAKIIIQQREEEKSSKKRKLNEIYDYDVQKVQYIHKSENDSELPPPLQET